MNINEDEHLTNEEVSAFVDALCQRNQHVLSESKLKHIWKCCRCEQQIIHVYHLRHPLFPDVGKNIEQLLEGLLPNGIS